VVQMEELFKDAHIPIPPHGQIQMIKRSKNDHERTSDDNDDVV